VGSLVLSIFGHCVNRTIAVGAPAIDDCPKWTWIVGPIFQLVMYPALLLLGRLAYDGNWESYLNATWDSSSFQYERLFLYSFFGYLVKDFFFMGNVLFLIHHAACMLCIVLTFALPCGFVATICGMVVLEAGTGCYALSKIAPPQLFSTAEYIYWIGMTLSNVVCLGLVLYNCVVVDLQMDYLTQLGMKFLFAAIAAVICFLRQHHEDMWHLKHKKEKKT